ncbi:MAG TPA: hypothetical protein VMG35_20615 [Bryobacteraceae bacterium]|nr:hypothetical protein [Bryobacteraceae bacterium]
MVLATLGRSRIAAMRELLATMNFEPGVVNPDNELVPFRQFASLHFARFLVLDDQTTGDLEALYGIRRPDPPVYFAFLGDFDGSYDALIHLLVQHAGPGLRRIFSLCDGFSPDDDLHAWITSHEQRPAAYYCNWVGRTVEQTRQEEGLRLALRACLEQTPGLADRSPLEIHRALRTFVAEETAAGRLQLTPPAPTPLAWALRHGFDWAVLVLLILGGVLTLPLTIIPLLLAAWKLRSLENSDPEFSPRPDRQWADNLALLEDHDVANQFSAMGTLKPGWFRSAVAAVVLRIIDLSARTIYTKGRLARVHTIHFARWVYLDNRKRMYFASNYDGSLEAYMDDFINKVGFGLNVVFSNGVGYPHTDWLLLKGAKNEQQFKYHLRRHQLPTEVWYNAHAGLTAFDLHRNSSIRQGLEASALDEQQCREWVALL